MIGPHSTLPILVGLALALAQSSVNAQQRFDVLEVRLHTTEASISGDNVTITTASGAKITVKRSDIIPARPSGATPTEKPVPRPDAPGAVGVFAREKCAADFPRDFAACQYCEKQQADGASWIGLRTMETPERKIIREDCAKEFPRDFATRNYCEERQIKALDALERR